MTSRTHRRTYLKGIGAAGVIFSTAGCLSWIRGGDGEDSVEDQESSVEDGEPPTKNDTLEASTEENATEGGENESTVESTEDDQSEAEEMPEAANPEPADNSPNESAYAGNESQAGEPTEGDIEVTSHDLKTDGSGATVEATFKNVWHDTIDVLDIRVEFLQDNKRVATDVWGTNNLAPGETWSHPFHAEGEQYVSVNDYEIYVENIQ